LRFAELKELPGTKGTKMASTFHYFRDTLQINLNTIRALNAPGGATIVFGARAITLSELVSGYSYVIATDELTLAPRAAAAIENSDGTTPTSVTVLARKIDGALRASVAGVAGPDGLREDPAKRAGGARAERQASSAFSRFLPNRFSSPWTRHLPSDGRRIVPRWRVFSCGNSTSIHNWPR
jgi:hypothetical protein